MSQKILEPRIGSQRVEARAQQNTRIKSFFIAFFDSSLDFYRPELRSSSAGNPVIVELVRSGTIVDTNYYGSYMWECRQRYSSDRWYIIGDAGDTVDPYSTINGSRT